MLKWPQKAQVKRKREKIRLIWLCMSRLLCFLLKIGTFFKVKINVWLRCNRISAYCVSTLCVLHTVKTPTWILRTKREGCHPPWCTFVILYIINFNQVAQAGIRLTCDSLDSTAEFPVMFVIREQKSVMSWTLPLQLYNKWALYRHWKLTLF